MSDTDTTEEQAEPRGRIQQDRPAFIRDVQRLIRSGRSGSLATTHRGRTGGPYASLTAYVPDHDGGPIFLFSDLSDHTQNLYADAQAAFLIEEGSRRQNPQRGPRVTLMGRISKSDNPSHRARYLARHPEAQMYEGFGDFGYFKFTVERIHYVGGFAKALWINKDDVLMDPETASAFAKMEAGVVDHMNDDHQDSIDLYANVHLGRKGTGWRMTGADAHGIDLALEGRAARLTFPQPLRKPDQLRGMLIALVKSATAD